MAWFLSCLSADFSIISVENATSMAQGTQITTLTVDDSDMIRKPPNIAAAYAGNIGQERVTYGSVGKRIFLLGAGVDAPRVDENIKLASGRFFTEEEDANLARVVVLGSATKETFFGKDDAVGKSITLKGEKYRVIGVLAPRGSSIWIRSRTSPSRRLGKRFSVSITCSSFR